MQDANHISLEQLQPFHDKIHEKGDAIIRYFLYGLFFFGLALSPFHNTYSIAVVFGGLSLGLYQLAAALLKGSLWLRLIISVLLGNFAFQFLWQMHGIYEMYFFYFIGMVLLLFYEDWRILLPLVIYTLLTYLILFYIDTSAENALLYLPERLPTGVKHVALYTTITLAYGLLCILWAIRKKKQTAETATSYLNVQNELSLMDTNINFANSISKGDLSVEYGAQRADRLGESLMNMRNSLVEAADREAKEKFVNVGLASIGDILRNNSDNIDELCNQVIQNLVKYMRVNQGGIFIIKKEENLNEPYLELKACRAYERKKYLEKKIAIGQGLVGQVALERKTVLMTDVPDSYMNITSGLGTANPNSLLIIPLKANEELIGVIELASFAQFNKNDVEFLEKVGESIASTVISVQTNQQTKELLEQSRQMTEEMQSQEEEMRQNMEEMQATQEEMGRTQKELAEKEVNLNALINNTSDSIITIDKNYCILVMNKVVKDRYKGSQYENMSVGDNALEMLGDVRDEWKEYYDKALRGERLEFVLKSSVQGESSYREYLINPIKDDNNNIIGASVFSRDVTDKKRLELAMSEKSSVLDAMMNNTDSTYFAMDKDFRIIYVNQTLKDRFKVNGLEITDGMNIYDILSGDALKIWKERYAKTLAGEKLTYKEDRIVGDKTLKIITYCFPIEDENNQITGVAVTSKDITTEENVKEQVAQLTAEIEKLKK